jgi:hypothetical protein
MEQQDSLPFQFIYHLITLVKSYHMLVKYRKNSDLKRGEGVDYYSSVFLLCILDLCVENIKKVKIKYYLIRIILKNSFLNEKKVQS